MVPTPETNVSRDISSNPRLSGKRLIAARLAFGTLVLVNLAFYSALLPGYVRALQDGFTGMFCINCDSAAGGIEVYTVPNSPADRAGVSPGDILLAVGGEDVASLGDLPCQVITGSEPGIDTFPIRSGLYETCEPGTYGRAGSEVTVTVRKANGALRSYTIAREVGWGTFVTRGLRTLGIPGGASVALALIVEGIIVLGFIGIGALLVWRKPTDWLTMYTALAATMWGVTMSTIPLTSEFWLPIARLQLNLSAVVALAFFFLFPDGRLTPRWAWIVIVLYAIFRLWIAEQVPDTASALIDKIPWIAGLYAQGYRYQRTATIEQRQQTKWVVYGMFIAVVVRSGSLLLQLSTLSPGPLFSSVPSNWFFSTLAGTVSYRMVTLAVPLTLVFAVLRYRLWDVNFIINRTLIYSALTTALGGLYLGSILALQGVFLRIGREDASAAAIATLTLVITLLFLPIHRRLQALIDRRYPRERLMLLQTPYLSALVGNVSTPSVGDSIQVATSLSSTFDLQEMLEHIMRVVHGMIPHDAMNIMLVEGDSAEVVQSRGYHEHGLTVVSSGLRFKIADTASLAQMAMTLSPLIIPDVQAHHDWRAAGEIARLRSYLGVPIHLNGQLLGFINVDSLSPNIFTTEHVKQIRLIARLAATAIHHAMLYQDTHLMIAELEERNIELGRFDHTVAHSLREPLSVIVGLANLLSTGYVDHMTAEVRDLLQYIESSAEKMDRIIQSLLLFAVGNDISDRITPIETEPIVRGALARFRHKLDERRVAVEVAPNLPPVVGFGPWLEEVFANLIDNAIKYIGDDNPSPRIVIRGQRVGEVARYEVEDNGLGIALEDQRDVFRPRTRFHPGEAAGFGLGLSIVRRIVTRLNGQVGVESTLSRGSTFWFTLPAADLQEDGSEECSTRD